MRIIKLQIEQLYNGTHLRLLRKAVGLERGAFKRIK